MRKLWTDEALNGELVARGKKRLATYSWSSFVEAVIAVLADACERVRTGRTPRYPDLDPAQAAGHRA